MGFRYGHVQYLFNSSSKKSNLFTTMFPDSVIANSFSCGKTKYGFIVKFGIAPYFVELLNSQLKDLEYFVVLFDESFNCVAKKKKEQKNKNKWTCIINFGILTNTKYYSSEFIGKLSANDTCSHLTVS